MSGLERCPACHPERSEGSLRPASEILRCAQDDRSYLQMSSKPLCRLQIASEYAILSLDQQVKAEMLDNSLMLVA